MKPVDAHCHLDFKQFDPDREEVIERCREELEFVVNAGSNLSHNRAALELEREHPGTIVANLGLHPVKVDSFDQLDRVKKQVRKHRPAAIGEIGLDHHHVEAEKWRKRQEQVFREMLELAEDLELPVVVHSRNAEQRAVEILQEYSLAGVMLHCFNGTEELAVEATNSGMKIGITTQVLYSDRVQQIVESVTLDDMLLETDSPYLYGDRNEPLNVRKSAEKIADLRDIEKQEVVNATSGNAASFFNQV